MTAGTQNIVNVTKKTYQSFPMHVHTGAQDSTQDVPNTRPNRGSSPNETVTDNSNGTYTDPVTNTVYPVDDRKTTRTIPVFEDATAGVQAGHDGHFGFVVGVGRQVLPRELVAVGRGQWLLAVEIAVERAGDRVPVLRHRLNHGLTVGADPHGRPIDAVPSLTLRLCRQSAARPASWADIEN